jgi:autotransporter-associated beta strand protein
VIRYAHSTAVGFRCSARGVQKGILLGACASLALATAFIPADAAVLWDFTMSGSTSTWTTSGVVVTKNQTVTMELGDDYYAPKRTWSLAPASGQYMAMIQPKSSTSVYAANIDATLQLTAGTFNTVLSQLSTGNQATDFGVLTKNVTLSPGTYTFYWSYAASDYDQFKDGVLFSLAGNGVNELDILAENTEVPQADTVLMANYGATTWAAKSFTITTGGSYQIGFASFNYGDDSDAFVPTLFIGDAPGTVFVAGSTSPIDTNAGYYPASGLGSVVNPDFQGGTLRIDSNGEAGSDFTVEAVSGGLTNVIDLYGNVGAFTGSFTGAGGLTITDSVGGGRVVFVGNAGYTGGTTILSGGTLQIGAGGTTGSIVGDIVNGGTLIFDRSDTVTFGGTISGGGALVQAGGGTLILNGTSTFNGPTAVTAGTLIIGDSTHSSAGVLGGVTVSNNAIVGGYGTIGGNLVASGGVVSPGNSIGTLKVTGNYTQSASSKLLIEVSPTTNDVLAVSGTATLGGTLAVSLAAGAYGTKSYAILTAGSVSGTFATVSYTGGSNDMVYGIMYAPKEVDLAMMPKVSGQIYGDLVTASLDTAHMLNRATLDRLDTAAGKGWSAWSRALAGASRSEASGGLADVNNQVWGVISGVDYGFGNGAKVSGVFSYTRSQLGVYGQNDKASSDGYFFALAGHVPVKSFTVDITGFVQHNVVDAVRGNIGASGHTTNLVGGGSVQAGYPLQGGDILPFARVTVASLTADSFSESQSGGLGLGVGDVDRTSVRGALGIEARHTYTTENGTLLVPRFTLGVEEEFGDRSRDLYMNFASTAFVAPAVMPRPVSLLLGGSLTAKLNNKIDLHVGANGRVSNNQKEGLLDFGVRYAF